MEKRKEVFMTDALPKMEEEYEWKYPFQDGSTCEPQDKAWV